MRPSFRRGVNKRKSAKHFRRQVSHTKAVNLRPGLARGGLRL